MWWWIIIVSTLPNRYKPGWLSIRTRWDWFVCPPIRGSINPVERFWKHLRRQVTHNHFFQTMERLMEAVTSFFREVATAPVLVRSVTGVAT